MYRAALKLIIVIALITPSIARADGGLGAIGALVSLIIFSLAIAAITPGLILLYSAIKSLKGLPIEGMSEEEARRKKIQKFIWPIILLVLGVFFVNLGLESA